MDKLPDGLFIALAMFGAFSFVCLIFLIGFAILI